LNNLKRNARLNAGVFFAAGAEFLGVHMRVLPKSAFYCPDFIVFECKIGARLAIFFAALFPHPMCGGFDIAM